MEKIVAASLIFLVITACGKQEFPQYDAEDESISHQVSNGTYEGKFISLNRTRVNAETLMWIKDNQFYVKIVMKSGPQNVRFHQYLHMGSRCPDMSDDENRDRKLDHFEVISVAGDILIPLDGDIEEQDKGSDWFPLSSRYGKFYYSRAASVYKLLRDLYKVDRSTGDGFSRLKPREELRLDQRIIIIYGNKSDPLLPVACAVITEKHPD